MKKLFYFLISILFVLALGTSFLYFQKLRKAQALKERVEAATALLKNQDFLKAWQFMHNDKDNPEPEVQYILFLSAFAEAYYREALTAWRYLPAELKEKQSVNTLTTLAAYAHQIDEHEQKEELVNLALLLYPDSKLVKDMQAGKYPLIIAKEPTFQSLSKNGATKRIDRNLIQKYLNHQDFYQAGQMLETALKKGLHQEDAEYVLINLASIYIQFDMLSSYRQLEDYVSQNQLAIALPAYFGNRLSNFVNGGELVLHKGRIYISQYNNNYLGFWNTDFLHRTAQEFSRQKIPVETLLQTPVSYLNARDNDLYFVSLQEGNKVKKYSLLDGKMETLVNRAVDQLFLAGNFLYYRDMDHKHLYRFNLQKGREEALIMEAIKSYVMTDQGIYFIHADDKAQVSFYAFATKEIKTVISHRVDELVTDTVRLVYINGSDQNRIWQADLNGKNSSRLLDWTDCSSLHLTENGHLYFSQWTLNRFDIRTKKVQQLSEYKALRIQVAEDKVIFTNENNDGHRYIALPDENQSFVIDP